MLEAESVLASVSVLPGALAPPITSTEQLAFNPLLKHVTLSRLVTCAAPEGVRMFLEKEIVIEAEEDAASSPSDDRAQQYVPTLDNLFKRLPSDGFSF